MGGKISSVNFLPSLSMINKILKETLYLKTKN